MNENESLVASLQTQVPSHRVIHSLFHRTTEFLAFVFLTRLHLVADLFAFEGIHLINFLLSHHQLFQVLWIVNFITRYLSLFFATDTSLVNECHAFLTVVIVALVLTLMSPTG